MDAVMYLKEKARLANGCTVTCHGCRLDEGENKRGTGCGGLEEKYPEEAVAIIEQWAKDCPEETYRTKFLKAFPKGNTDGICVKKAFGDVITLSQCESRSCSICWDRPYKEEN